MTPAAAEIEAVLSFRLDCAENSCAHAAAAIACETINTRRGPIFLDRRDRVLVAVSAEVAVRRHVRRVLAAPERRPAENTVP